MPEIKFPTDWVKIGNNVDEGDLLMFTDAGTLDKENERYVFMVEIIRNGVVTDKKKFQLNKGNFTAVSELYGTNSDNWVGKTMGVTKIKVRNPQTGLKVDSIELVPPTEQKSAEEIVEEAFPDKQS